MALGDSLSVERLREVLDYDPTTGEFRWRRGRYKGIAGAVMKLGYRTISVGGGRFYAHRLAWFYVHGAWPPDQVDHLNGDRDDNRLSNLRLATNKQNIENRHRVRSDSRSGLRGVQIHKQTGRWRARIKVAGRYRHLGLFDSPEEASRAYLAAKQELHPFWAGSLI